MQVIITKQYQQQQYSIDIDDGDIQPSLDHKDELEQSTEHKVCKATNILQAYTNPG